LLQVTEQRVKAFASFIVEEFLVCQSGRDAAESVCELKAESRMHAVLVYRMLLTALDKPPGKHPMVADLLSSLVVRTTCQRLISYSLFVCCVER
jgi:hypothetical protein